ncbi:MAG TPA: ROK family protein [Actinocrinis sp.]|nr:ROK family protein [Actinocrinis sp.]
MEAVDRTGIALGIDIGGTGIKGAPVDLATGAMVGERFRLDTPRPAVPESVAETVGRVAANFAWSGPVGVTFPGVVSHGVVRTAANLDEGWLEVDAAELFGRVVDVGGHGPVRVLNDADAAGLAEVAHGAGRGQAGVVMLLTFGTGIGSALFLNGRLVPNTELGHLEIRGKDAEVRASVRAKEDGEMSWHKWAGKVEEYLSHVDALFSPDLMIIGGGVSKHPDKFLPLLTLRAPVVAATLANTAGIVGAALATGTQAE